LHPEGLPSLEFAFVNLRVVNAASARGALTRESHRQGSTTGEGAPGRTAAGPTRRFSTLRLGQVANRIAIISHPIVLKTQQPTSLA
jgi:hypothetical protein